MDDTRIDDLSAATLRHVPSQERSRQRLRAVLDAAEKVLSTEGAGGLSTTRIAQVARVPVGSVYRYFPDKEAVVDALAVRYWSDFGERVAELVEADAREPLAHPVAAVVETMAEAFRSEPGFRALWYGSLRTERVRDVTRGARDGFARSLERILEAHWPDSSPELRETTAGVIVVAGDGLLREAFRLEPTGDRELLAESTQMLDAYLVARLGERAR